MTSMNPAAAQSLLVIYYLVLGVLFVYGLHRLLLVALYYRSRERLAGTKPALDEWPMVTVQLPLYNEKYVAQRLIDAVCRFDYPRKRLEIQVLDDSTDNTRELVAQHVAHYREQGFQITHIHRSDRAGFKAGALKAGLDRARGNFLAVFDADFTPEPSFLKETLPSFAESDVGMVQARWGHLNRGYSLLTRVQAIFLDGHFAIEHAARNGSGRFFNFNGTAGVWRRQAILDAGGWHHDTLTEDLDLSYRAQLAGWRFVFLPHTLAPAELPVDVNAFKRQQHRWAKGSVQTARKLLGPLLRASLPLKGQAGGLGTPDQQRRLSPDAPSIHTGLPRHVLATVW
jgi:cellulose synthase/poly-beta-1,6-N-acetylglucosamine synthase-like glycosyltransferase